MLRFMFGAWLACTSLGIAAQPLDPALTKRIDGDVQSILRRSGTPGATVLVVRNGQIVYRQAYGLRDRERRLPARTDTHYEIGSITKQFTVAAILQLQEAGKLDIDAKLATYLPTAPHASEVTLRQLLSHTSGLPDYLDGPKIEEEATHPTTFTQLMARIDGKPLDFAPGSHWSYDNTGYILLGRIVELVSHESYRHYVQTHLLDRAGMKQTFTVADEASVPGMAVGYRHAEGRLERAPTIHDSWGWSAGNLVSTVDDLQKWNDALTGGRIVAPKSYTAMTTPVIIQQHSAEYGFGLFVDTVEEQPRIGHTGGSFGFTSANEYFPKQDVRIIAFTNNGDNPEPGEMITTAVFNQLFPAIAAAAARPSPGEDAAVTATTRTLFAQLQGGNEDTSRLSAKLNTKMKGGLAQRLSKEFAPYGAPTAFVFKGRRTESGLHWYDYLIQFGPGAQLKFAAGLDDAGKIGGLSFG